jgi:hypothetical protein
MYTKIEKKAQQGVLTPPKKGLICLMLGEYVHISPLIEFSNILPQITTIL